MNTHTPQRGFTIFIAMLIAAFALAIGLAIYDLAVRELLLSGIQTQSQYAIYAADSGAECALYWDSHFSTTTTNGSAFATSSSDTEIAVQGQVLCNSQDIVAGGLASNSMPWTITSSSNSATTTFWFSLGQIASNPCASVTVAKYGTPSRTTITSFGYNTCIQNVSNKVERELEVNY